MRNNSKPKVVNRIQISSRSKNDKPTSLKNQEILNEYSKDLFSKIDSILCDFKPNEKIINDLNSISTKNDESKSNKENDQENFSFNLNENNLLINKNENDSTNILKKSYNSSKKILPKLKNENNNINIINNNNNIIEKIVIENPIEKIEKIEREALKKQPKKKSNVKKPSKTKLANNENGEFLTDVGIIKQIKKNKISKKQKKFIAKTDKEINDLINNIDELDNYKYGHDLNDTFDGSPEFRARMEQNKRDFEELVKEIDGYRDDMREEFDIIKYLIKFTDNTEKLINRHKTVITNIFNSAGLQSKRNKSFDLKNKKNLSSDEEENKSESEDDDYEYSNNNKFYGKNYDKSIDGNIQEINKIFYKMKKINKIKDNLCNIQDETLDYHEKLKNKMKRSYSAKPPIKNNNDTNNKINEIKENNEEEEI